MACSRLNRFQGFTLVEMLLVLVILAVSTAGVSISLTGRRERYALKASSLDLAEAIRYAASEANITEVPHRIVFKDRASYWVEKKEQNSVDEFISVTGMPGRSKTLMGHVRIMGFYRPDGQANNSITDSIVFDQSVGSFSGQICLQGHSNQQVKIYVNGISGQVDIGE